MAPRDVERLVKLQRQHSSAVAAGDLLTVFYSNLSFHQVLFGLCGNACLTGTIELLAQKKRLQQSLLLQTKPNARRCRQAPGTMWPLPYQVL